MSPKRCLVLLMLALSVAGNALATDADGDRARHYPLTMARVQASYDAQLNMIKVAVRNPDLGSAMEMDADEPAAQTIARYEAQPELKKALADAGLTPRDFVYISLAYMGAAFGAIYQQNTHGPLDKAYDADNVAFFRAHQKELGALQAKFQQQAEALAGDSDDDSD